MVAPYGLKNNILKLIEREKEKGEEGKIILKMNSLTDREIIDSLAKASQNGVKIQMIIRGICSMLPNIENKTENITVKSIVGRFLEHARIFVFGDEDEQKIYISSADFMTRNTEKRVEIAAPVKDKNLQKELLEFLEFELKDDVKGRILTKAGIYEKPPAKYNFSSQEEFMKMKRKG